jgi:hypothetical protein
VTRYAVYRTKTSNCAVTPATRLGGATARSLRRAVPAAGTYYFRVVAQDAVGNLSVGSLCLKVKVSGSKSTLVTVALIPTADAYVNKVVPTKSFGTEPLLASGGGTGYVSYLRFALPKAATGLRLTSARLQIRTTADTFAGSVTRHQVRFVKGRWSERTVTWKTRPALTGSVLGSTPRNAAVGHATYAILSARALRKLLGQTINLGMTNGNKDSLWFWSKERPNPLYAPQLVVTYTP